MKIGIENGDQGFVTTKNPEYQHFKVVKGLSGHEGSISFESIARPGHFLRHKGYLIFLHKNDTSDLYKNDASFYPRYNKYFRVSFKTVAAGCRVTSHVELRSKVRRYTAGVKNGKMKVIKILLF